MKLTITSFLAIILCACAAKPTHLLVDPAVSAPQSGIGSGIAISINVSADPVPSALSEMQSRFPLKRPASVAINEKLTRELSAMGFNVVAQASRQLNVSLVKVQHTITDGTLRDDIEAQTVIQFDAITEFGTMNKKFSDNRMQQVGGTATLGEASGVLNLSVGHVLGRALSDAELLQFLSRQ